MGLANAILQAGSHPAYRVTKESEAFEQVEKGVKSTKIQRQLARLKARRPDLVEKGFFKAGGPGSGRKPEGLSESEESLMEMGFMPETPLSRSAKPPTKLKKYVKAKKIKAGGPGSGWTHEGGHVSHLMNDQVINTPVVPSPGKHAAAGIIVKNDKGHILIYSPKNNFGGYKNTFSKGTIEPGQTPQEAAIRELKEETGIEAKITGHLGSVERSTSTTRYYTGEQTGGTLTPSDESDNPRFVPIDDKLSDLLRNTSGKKTGDHEVLELLKNSGGKQLNVMHEKLSNAKGTNKGGLYKGSDGVKRYVKFYNDKGQGHAEAAANSIYRDLGLGAPKSQIFGQHDFASDIIEGGRTLESEGLTKENAREVLKGFAADVLTANWDAVGLTYDNILMKDGKAHRIDNGSAFTYRAQGGGSKPQALLNKATEYEGFFSPAINREYAALTKKAGYKSADEIPDIKQQVSTIANLEKSSGGWDTYLSKKAPYLSDHERQTFAKMLTSRTAALAFKFPDLKAEDGHWVTENGRHIFVDDKLPFSDRDAKTAKKAATFKKRYEKLQQKQAADAKIVPSHLTTDKTFYDKANKIISELSKTLKGDSLRKEAGKQLGITAPEIATAIKDTTENWKDWGDARVADKFKKVMDGDKNAEPAYALEYAITQHNLKQSYPDGKVTLHRGLGSKGSAKVGYRAPQADNLEKLKSIGPSGVSIPQSKALESWSLSKTTATTFATTGPEDDGVVLSVDVPIKNVAFTVRSKDKEIGGWQKEFAVGFPSGKIPLTKDNVKWVSYKQVKAAAARVIEAGGAGSGWTTENGHVSHAAGKTLELAGPHSVGYGVSKDITDLGLKYHHTLTTKHSTGTGMKVKDYFVDPVKKMAVMQEKGLDSQKKWSVGSLLTVGNKTIFTTKGDGINTDVLLDKLKEFGYGSKTGEGVSPVTSLEQLHKVQPIQQLKQAIQEANPEPESHSKAVNSLKDLGFTGPSPYGSKAGTVSYTKGSEQYVVSKGPTGGLEWDYTDGKSKVAGNNLKSLEKHLDSLKLSPVQQLKKAVDEANTKYPVDPSIVYPGNPGHIEVLKNNGFQNTFNDSANNKSIWQKGNLQVVTMPGLWEMEKDGSQVDDGFGVAKLQDKISQHALEGNTKKPDWNPATENQAKLDAFHNSAVNEGYTYQSSKLLGGSGMIQHTYTKPNPDAAGAIGKVIFEDTTPAAVHNDGQLGYPVHEDGTPLKQPNAPIGDPDNIEKVKELGFKQDNNAADGKSTLWKHPNGMSAITRRSSIGTGTGWKLFDKDGHELSYGKGPTKLHQQFVSNGGSVPGVNAPTDASGMPLKAETPNKAWLVSKAATLNDKALVYKDTIPAFVGKGTIHRFADASNTGLIIAHLIERPDGAHELKVGDSGSTYGLSDEKASVPEGPKFSPNSKAQQWLQDKANLLNTAGYTYKKSSAISTAGPGAAWHKYAAPGTGKDGPTEAMIVEKPGGVHELVINTPTAVLKDESKVDSIEDYPTGTQVSITKPGKEYDSQENIPKAIVTDKAYFKKVADTVAEVLKDNPPDFATTKHYYGARNLSGYTEEGQRQLRLAAAAKLGVSSDAIAKVQYDVSSWTGSSFKEMREAGLKVIDKAKDADPAWIIEHEVNVQQLKKAHGDTIDVSRGLKVNSYSDSEFPKDMTNQLVAIKALLASASPDWHVGIKSHGGDSWSLSTSTAKGFSGGILIKAKNVPIDYAVTSYETNPNFGGGESEVVVAFPKGIIPANHLNTVAASKFTALPSDALIAGYIGTLRNAGWKIEVSGKNIIIHEKYPQTGNPPKITAGGPGSGRHKEFPSASPVAAKPRLSMKHQLALDSYKPADKKIHKTAGIGEQLVRDALNAVPTADNMPFDVITRNGHHAIEVKTLTTQTNDKITMHPASLRRKYAWAEHNGAKAHTVVLDMRHGAKTPTAVYYQDGVGSFRIGSMHQLSNGLSELKRAIR